MWWIKIIQGYDEKAMYDCLVWNLVFQKSDEVISIKVNQWNKMVKVELHPCFESWLLRKKCIPH